MTAQSTFVTYLRVSTANQDPDGLGIAGQRLACERIIGDGEVLAEFVERASGTRDNRPQLKAAIKFAKEHDAVVCVARLDRLSRSVGLINLLNRDVDLKITFADMPSIDTRQPGGRLMLNVMASMAEFESDLASARSKASYQAMLADPDKRDRAPGIRSAREAREAYEQIAPEILAVLNAEPDISNRGLARRLTERGIMHPRTGKPWNHSAAQRAREAISA